MRAFRWVLAFVASMAGYSAGILGVVLLTRHLVPGAGISHFWAMFTGCLLAVYTGAAVVRRRDRVIGALCFAVLAVSVPAVFLFVEIGHGKQFTEGMIEFLGACAGAAFAVKITPGRKEGGLA